MNRKIIAFIVFILAVSLSTAQSHNEDKGDFKKEFHQTYPLSANGSVELENVNGDVEINSWDRNEVKIDAVLFADSQEKLDDLEVDVRTSNDRITIETKYQKNRFRNVNNPGGVDYVVTVPRNASLDGVQLVNGSLSIANVGGAIQASCVNGKLSVKNVQGRLELSTVNGSLEASLVKLENPVKINSVNGSITVILPANADAQIEADTVNGNIRNDFGLAVKKGRYVGSEMEARLGNGKNSIDVSNVNGSISFKQS